MKNLKQTKNTTSIPNQNINQTQNQNLIVNSLPIQNLYNYNLVPNLNHKLKPFPIQFLTLNLITIEIIFFFQALLVNPIQVLFL